MKTTFQAAIVATTLITACQLAHLTRFALTQP